MFLPYHLAVTAEPPQPLLKQQKEQQQQQQQQRQRQLQQQQQHLRAESPHLAAAAAAAAAIAGPSSSSSSSSSLSHPPRAPSHHFTTTTRERPKRTSKLPRRPSTASGELTQFSFRSTSSSSSLHSPNEADPTSSRSPSQISLTSPPLSPTIAESSKGSKSPAGRGGAGSRFAARIAVPSSLLTARRESSDSGSSGATQPGVRRVSFSAIEHPTILEAPPVRVTGRGGVGATASMSPSLNAGASGSGGGGSSSMSGAASVVSKLQAKVGLKSKPSRAPEHQRDASPMSFSNYSLSGGDPSPRSRNRGDSASSHTAADEGDVDLWTTMSGVGPSSSSVMPPLRTMSSRGSTSTIIDDGGPSISSKRWSRHRIPCQEDADIQGQPLPVRLGLVYPLAPEEPGPMGTRYVDGYYLHTPPPLGPRRRSFSNGSLVAPPSASSVATPPPPNTPGSSSGAPGLRRVLTNGSEDGGLGIRRDSADHASPTASSSARRPALARSNTSGSSKRGNDPIAAANGSSMSPRGGSNRTLGSLGSNGDDVAARWDPESYFTYKRDRAPSGGDRWVRYHAYTPKEVPYFLAHDSSAKHAELLLNNITFSLLSERHSVIPWRPDNLPKRVLDLGTGTGEWCLEAARDWKQTEFIGLDAVPSQTPVAQLKDPDLEHRVSWVVANFLDGLPFPNDSFDLVHMRNVGSVSFSESQWPDLISEITRVLQPGGRFELLDFNWSFTGNLRNVPLSDLVHLAPDRGRARSTSTPAAAAGAVAPPVPSPIRPSSASPSTEDGSVDEPKPYAMLEQAFERIFARRFINPRLLSIVPLNVTGSELQGHHFGIPRRIALTAKDEDFRKVCALDVENVKANIAAASKGASPSAQTSTPVDSDEEITPSFNTRPPVGAPLLNSGFRATREKLSPLRTMSLLAHSEMIYSARDLVWDESEQEKSLLLSHSVSSRGAGPGSRLATSDESASWAHPWADRQGFEKAMHAYRQDMHVAADVGTMVKERLGWRSANLESVAERKMGERQRKLDEGLAWLRNEDSGITLTPVPGGAFGLSNGGGMGMAMSSPSPPALRFDNASGSSFWDDSMESNSGASGASSTASSSSPSHPMTPLTPLAGDPAGLRALGQDEASNSGGGGSSSKLIAPTGRRPSDTPMSILDEMGENEAPTPPPLRAHPGGYGGGGGHAGRTASGGSGSGSGSGSYGFPPSSPIDGSTSFFPGSGVASSSGSGSSASKRSASSATTDSSCSTPLGSGSAGYGMATPSNSRQQQQQQARANEIPDYIPILGIFETTAVTAVMPLDGDSDGGGGPSGMKKKSSLRRAPPIAPAMPAPAPAPALGPALAVPLTSREGQPQHQAERQQ